MSPKQALDIVNQALEQVVANRATHVQIQEAYKALEDIVNKEAENKK